MSRWWPALVGAFLTSCGPDRDGATFAWQSPLMEVGMLPGDEQDWLTPEVLDTSALHVLFGLAELDLPLWLMADEVRSARVEVFAEAWPCIGPFGGETSPDITCEGQQFDYKLRIAKAPCVWTTSFSHELTHLLLDLTTGDPDGAHRWAEAWVPAGELLGECPGGLSKMPSLAGVDG